MLAAGTPVAALPGAAARECRPAYPLASSPPSSMIALSRYYHGERSGTVEEALTGNLYVPPLRDSSASLLSSRVRPRIVRPSLTHRSYTQTGSPSRTTTKDLASFLYTLTATQSASPTSNLGPATLFPPPDFRSALGSYSQAWTRRPLWSSFESAFVHAFPFKALDFQHGQWGLLHNGWTLLDRAIAAVARVDKLTWVWVWVWWNRFQIRDTIVWIRSIGGSFASCSINKTSPFTLIIAPALARCSALLPTAW